MPIQQNCPKSGFILTGFIVITHTWRGLRAADALLDEAVPDLPGEDGGALRLVRAHPLHHAQRRHARLRTADRLRADGARLVISGRESLSLLFTQKRCYQKFKTFRPI